VARLHKLRRPGHGEPMGTGWRFVWFVLYYPVSGLVKLRYRNIERMPQDGPVIVVTNHVSHIDPFLVSKFVLDAARTPHFLAKESIFAVPVVGWGMRVMGHIPVKRGTSDARQSLAAAIDALGQGKVIVLHPEGTVTRDPDGWPMNGKTGAARLAALVPDVPVIPLAQWGVQEQIDLYTRTVKLFPRPRHVISVGEPIDLGEFRGKEITPDLLHAMTGVIIRRLRADVAQLRGLPEPQGEPFEWRRPHEHPGDAA
jgi:1-acyl-sn-glycerol-3-phosphate acyltransferase